MKTIALFLLSTLMLTGCGEFSYKRGASAQELQETKRLCEASENDQDVEKCLAKHGWHVHNFDKESLFAIPTITENNPSLNIVVNEKSGEETSTVKSATIPAARMDQAQSGTTAKTTESTLTKKVQPKADESPTKVYKLNSWWKLGGNPTTLNGQIQECASLLGEQHKPDMEKGLYTRALVICMHNKGWKPLLSPNQ